MTKYSKSDLLAFIERADDLEKLDAASAFIRRLRIPNEWEEDISDAISRRSCALDSDWIHSVTEGDYSASSPWNAPGMSARDFI